MKNPMRQLTTFGLMTAVSVAAVSFALAANAEGMKKSHRLLLKSAIENADYTEVTLPIFEGQRSGETVWFVVTESSDKADAATRGVHYSPKMANGKGTLAVQSVGMVSGKVQFPAVWTFRRSAWWCRAKQGSLQRKRSPELSVRRSTRR